MTSFKQTSQQYHAHKQLLQLLTHSISSDQQLLKLLQGLKKYAEANEDAKVPDEKYSAFINNLDFTIDQKELNRTVAKAVAKEEPIWDGYWDEGYPDSDGKIRPPYT